MYEIELKEENSNLKSNLVEKLEAGMDQYLKTDELGGTLEQLVTLIKHTTMTTREIQQVWRIEIDSDTY